MHLLAMQPRQTFACTICDPISLSFCIPQLAAAPKEGGIILFRAKKAPDTGGAMSQPSGMCGKILSADTVTYIFISSFIDIISSSPRLSGSCVVSELCCTLIPCVTCTSRRPPCCASNRSSIRHVQTYQL